MHKEGVAEPVHFEKIRALILANSDFIVQDDSGVPLRLFARDTWKLRFHGTYEAPTPEFGKYLQKRPRRSRCSATRRGRCRSATATPSRKAPRTS